MKTNKKVPLSDEGGKTLKVDEFSKLVEAYVSSTPNKLHPMFVFEKHKPIQHYFSPTAWGEEKINMSSLDKLPTKEVPLIVGGSNLEADTEGVISGYADKVKEAMLIPPTVDISSVSTVLTGESPFNGVTIQNSTMPSFTHLNSVIAEQNKQIANLSKLYLSAIEEEKEAQVELHNLTVANSKHLNALIESEAKLQLLRDAISTLDLKKPNLKPVLDAFAASYHENIAIQMLQAAKLEKEAKLTPVSDAEFYQTHYCKNCGDMLVGVDATCEQCEALNEIMLNEATKGLVSDTYCPDCGGQLDAFKQCLYCALKQDKADKTAKFMNFAKLATGAKPVFVPNPDESVTPIVTEKPISDYSWEELLAHNSKKITEADALEEAEIAKSTCKGKVKGKLPTKKKESLPIFTATAKKSMFSEIEDALPVGGFNEYFSKIMAGVDFSKVENKIAATLHDQMVYGTYVDSNEGPQNAAEFAESLLKAMTLSTAHGPIIFDSLAMLLDKSESMKGKGK